MMATIFQNGPPDHIRGIGQMNNKNTPPDRSFGRGPITRVVAPSLSFGQHPGLVERLRALYPDAKINTEGRLIHLNEDELIEYLRGYEAALVSLEWITDRVLASLPELRVVVKLGVGLDKIDPEAMRRHGVRLGWKAGVNATSVAELTICTAIMALRHVLSRNLQMRAGKRPMQAMGRLLSGRTVGVHGCGHVGREFIRLLQPFGCEILANDIEDRSAFYAKHGVKAVGTDELWARSEILSIHLTVTNKTRGLYGPAVLDRLRPDCILINTARGQIVDEAAVKERLKDGRLAIAAIDAFQREPNEDDEFLNLPNLIATPHIGASSEEARWSMGVAAIEGITDNFIVEPGVCPFDDR
jgi:D-3-phosphoglycerate dehydrogenase